MTHAWVVMLNLAAKALSVVQCKGKIIYMSNDAGFNGLTH